MVYIVNFLFCIDRYEMLPAIQSTHRIVEVTQRGHWQCLLIYLFVYLIYSFNLFIYLVKGTVKEIV